MEPAAARALPRTAEQHDAIVELVERSTIISVSCCWPAIGVVCRAVRALGVRRRRKDFAPCRWIAFEIERIHFVSGVTIMAAVGN